VWDVINGAELACHRVGEMGGLRIAWSPDGRWIACGGVQGNVLVYDAETYRLAAWFDHESSVIALAFLSDGSTIFSADSRQGAWFRDMHGIAPPRRLGSTGSFDPR
jgi:WD40 repeat protein